MLKLTLTVGVLLLLAISEPARPVPQPPRPSAAQVLPPARGGTQVGGEPAVVLNAEKGWAGADVLMPLATSSDPAVRHFAFRAIGRLENPALVPQLLVMAAPGGGTDAEIAGAIGQSLHGFDPSTDPALVSSVLEWMRKVGLDRNLQTASAVVAPISHIAYADGAQVRGAEEILMEILDRTADDVAEGSIYGAAMHGAESLARLNAKVTTLGPKMVKRLVRSVGASAVNDSVPGVRADALAALIAGGGLDAETEHVALHDADPRPRRLAMAVLAGSGAGLDTAARLPLIEEGLRDASPFVRYEAVRAYVRREAQTARCQPILDLLLDPDSHVALAAIDALGDLCKGDEDATRRIAAEARTPETSRWNRETHAFVALAKRDPERAAIAMGAFATHPVWWVRMYAVRAAAATGDLVRLEKLAYDDSDNVREAALGPFHKLAREDANRAIVAALGRPDYQLLRTAAMFVKGFPADRKLAAPLVDAVLRVTRDASETSRDARLALLDAIAVHADAGDATRLRPLLKDFDPKIALEASAIIGRLTGKPAAAQPAPFGRGWPQQFDNLRQCVTVTLKSGRAFTMTMDPGSAPITVDRFLTLAAVDHYYNGLTIHRVVPNFLIQGGSPGANEYAGNKAFMRDEIAGPNTRGSVGLSTRGRNTADAQFYINLVDNNRLDGEYTTFAHVSKGMDVVDGIEEGEAIQTMRAVPCSGQ